MNHRAPKFLPFTPFKQKEPIGNLGTAPIDTSGTEMEEEVHESIALILVGLVVGKKKTSVVGNQSSEHELPNLKGAYDLERKKGLETQEPEIE